ncbi:MAG: hypothetical protein CMF74_00735 [Maricaulis sp.]|jgi:hypothetical protein|nr:hypothetical protein [Maricaulis sp.]HAQ35315.1 DUF2891 domain-containing protein [Alphaproteobacteria bacterium]
MKTIFRLALPALCLMLTTMPARADTPDPELANRFARLALDCVQREYPNKIAHVLQSADDARAPSELTPVFYGCYDWHSAVHGHWLLVRLLRLMPDGEFAAEAEAALAHNFTPDRVAGEVAYFAGDGRASFERPYGLAWLLQLMSELREWDDPRAREWAETLAPLEAVVADRYRAWLPNLAYPIRIGTHNQSAFGLALALDWTRTTGDAELEQLITSKVLEFHLEDTACPLGYEPSGEDFLSPCLYEADLMRRVLPGAVFSAWLSDFLPGIPEDGTGDWLEPGVVLDASDGKLVHLDGVNLSRAWNLEAIAGALPVGDPRIASLQAAADIHRETGLASVTDEHYEGGHWLGSFATYLVTGRGLDVPQATED